MQREVEEWVGIIVMVLNLLISISLPARYPYAMDEHTYQAQSMLLYSGIRINGYFDAKPCE